MTQNDLIAEHLASGQEIDPMTALRDYGIFRLAARIYDLRGEGLLIAERTVRAGKKHWSAYKLAFQH